MTGFKTQILITEEGSWEKDRKKRYPEITDTSRHVHGAGNEVGHHHDHGAQESHTHSRIETRGVPYKKQFLVFFGTEDWYSKKQLNIEVLQYALALTDWHVYPLLFLVFQPKEG